MTAEEIKKIARAFAEETSHGDALDPHIDFAEAFAAEVLQWLCKDYAIVEKSKLQREYKKSYSAAFEHTSCLDRQYARGRYQVLREILGKPLFEEEK